MAQLLQVESPDGSRRNVGATVGPNGAVRVLAPETESLLSILDDHLQAQRTELAGYLKSLDEKTGPGGSTERTLLDVKRAVTDYEVRLDYDGRTDGNPVYVGKAEQGTDTGVADWTVQRLDYDDRGRLTRAQVASSAAWDQRHLEFT